MNVDVQMLFIIEIRVVFVKGLADFAAKGREHRTQLPIKSATWFSQLAHSARPSFLRMTRLTL